MMQASTSENVEKRVLEFTGLTEYFPVGNDALGSETENMDDDLGYSSVLLVKSEEKRKAREEQTLEIQSISEVTEVKKTFMQAEPIASKKRVRKTKRGDAPPSERSQCHCCVVFFWLLTLGIMTILGAAVAFLLIHLIQLQQEKEALKVERDYLNGTLGVIFQFSNFQVDHFCPILDNCTQERKCYKPCKERWVYYQSSCYQFISSDWPNWESSQNHCNSIGAHLVVIDTLEEQAFINNHTKDMDNEGNGYWIGLSRHDDKWQWVNGSDLIGGYWITNEWYNCVATMPSTDPSRSWKAKHCAGTNRWICEMEATIWPD
ncbi:C-type lectin domain family 4 member A [Engraulis encrasicolus]|uniref:C-type lectin domain family 4 member A n=1 Tax=Engraulis encrasicolus TaxID=184585 RepID=UPI002FCF801A